MLLFRPTFWLLHPLSFSINGKIPLCQAERSPVTFFHNPSSYIPRGNRLPFLPSTFFWTMGGWWDISTFVCCVHEHASLSYPNPNWFLSVYLEDPRLLGVSRHPGLVPFWASQQIFLTKTGLSFLFPFPSFSKAQNLPIHGFGPPPTYLKWTLIGRFWPCPFFESPNGF